MRYKEPSDHAVALTRRQFARLQSQVKKTPFLYLGKDSIINDEESALKVTPVVYLSLVIWHIVVTSFTDRQRGCYSHGRMQATRAI